MLELYKNGQIKLKMLKWAKLFLKYNLFYKEPDDVNLTYWVSFVRFYIIFEVGCIKKKK